MKKMIFYIKNELAKSINLSKISLYIRNLNEEEYNDLISGFKNIILTDKDLQLAKDYYDLINKKKKFTNAEKIELFDNISKSKNEKIIINIYNGFNKSTFEVLTLENIEKELNNFLMAELDSEEFDKHFYKDYIYIC